MPDEHFFTERQERPSVTMHITLHEDGTDVLCSITSTKPDIEDFGPFQLSDRAAATAAMLGLAVAVETVKARAGVKQ